jgi:predicted PurR-regulated permease PerM
MPDSRVTFDIAPRALVKVLAMVVLVWLWLSLWRLLMLVVMAIVLAISLDPIVDWLCRRRIPRAVAAPLIVVLLAAIITTFFLVGGSSLASQAQLLSSQLQHAEHLFWERAPAVIRNAMQRNGFLTPDATSIAGYVVGAGRLVTAAIIVGVLALVLTIYLLIEGRTAYEWMIAYVPPDRRDRAHVTAHEAVRRIRGYVAGNVVTSSFAIVFVYLSLTLLKVPGAMLLALLAGVFDFVPVLGFILSSVPAVILGFGVSPLVGLVVAALYVLYHLIENYYLGPKVYGGKLRLSHLAVILAFAVGAEVGGIVGAILALPVAAMYPVIEAVWLKEYLGRDAVETHRRIERRKEVG